MEGPEHLEVETGTLRRRGRLAIAFALVVLGGLGAYRLDQPDARDTTDPAPTAIRAPRTSAPTAAPSTAAPWPTDLGQGTLFIRDNDGLIMVDLTTGSWLRSGVRAADPATTITAARGGVLVSHDDTRELPLLASGTSVQGQDVEASLRTGQRFLPGPLGSVWMSSLSTNVEDRGVWQLVNPAGQTTARVKVSGRAISDGSGGLLDLGDDDVRHLVVGRPPTQVVGEVVAVGPDGYETQACTGRRCSNVLIAQPGDRRTTLARTTPSASARRGALSPGNRFVASVASADDSEKDPTQVRVAVPGSQRPLRVFAGKTGGSTLAWITDRWLVATQDDGVTLYNAETDEIVEPSLPLDDPDQLVSQGV